MPSQLASLLRCGRTPWYVLPTLRSLQQLDTVTSIWLVTDDSTAPQAREWLAALAARERCRFLHVAGRTSGARRNATVQACGEDFIHFIDAGDTLERSFSTQTSDWLIRDHQVPFVTTAALIAGPGSMRSVVSPAAADFRSLLVDPRVIHGSTVFRRKSWVDAGGFDEVLPALEDYEFWLRLAQSAEGAVVYEPLLVRPLRQDTRPDDDTESALRASALSAILARHTQPPSGVEPADLLVAAEERLRTLAAQYQRALQRRDDTVAEITTLTKDTQTILATVPPAPLDFGDFQRVTPVSRNWGYERGGAVDRRYIEAFLREHQSDIRGTVLEVQEPDYTQRFGGDRVTKSDVVDLNSDNPRATILSDLRAAANIPENTYDCVILTQTLHVIDDIPAVIAECHRILKPGGVVLATLPSASRICAEYGQDGDFWRVTEAGARRLFGQAFCQDQLLVEARGNVLTNAAFLYGVGIEELKPEDYAFNDPYYPAVVMVRGVKAGAPKSLHAWSGAAHIQRSEPGAGRPLAGVLIYHRVASPASDVHRLAIAPDAFRRQMKWLRDRCHPVSLQSLLESIRTNSVEPGTVAITFDDGYLDNFSVASPILEELGLPATFFITTEGIQNDQPYEFWWDRLERLMMGPGPCPTRLKMTQAGSVRDLPTGTAAERFAAHWVVYEAIVGAGDAEREAVLDDLARWRPESSMDLSARRMTRAEVAALAVRSGHTIGAHTVRHLMLPRMSNEVVVRELADNRQVLQQITGQPIAHFAYPFGAFDSTTADAVRRAGFTCGLACGDAALPMSPDPMALPRIDPLAKGDAPFADWLPTRVARPLSTWPAIVTAGSPPASKAVGGSVRPRRAIVAGWFSYTHSDFTAGDLLACDLVREWLKDAGIESDVALVPPLAGGVALDRADPAGYSHAVFVCGPFHPAKLEAEFLAKFHGCMTIGVNLSLPVPLTEWNPFSELFERNSSRAAHADIVFATKETRVPVIGLCLVEAFEGADTRAANAAIERLLAGQQGAIVPIDTRLDVNDTGLRSKAEVESLIARMDVIVTTRLHGTVLALKNGVPVVVIDPEPGESRVLTQAKAIGWPMAFAVDAVDDKTLRRALDYCLTPEARTKAAECRARADADVADVRARFIAAIRSGGEPTSPS